MATETTKLTFVEGAAAATPAGSRTVIYAKADGLMYSKDDAGVETLMSGGAGGGSVATDAIWDAKGDLAGGTGANTAARLAVGANGLSLVANSAQSTGLEWSSVVGILQSAKATRTAGDVTTTSTTFVDLTGMSVTLTTGARRCLVYFQAVSYNSAGNAHAFDVNIDGSRVGGTLGWTNTQGSNRMPVSIFYLTNVLTAASHTIKIQWYVIGGTGTVQANTTTTTAELTVLETGLTS
jgi:hypothetical protein